MPKVPSVFEHIGGIPGCHRLSVRFYALVERDPVLRPFFPRTFTCAIADFAAFLVQLLAPPDPANHAAAERRQRLSLEECHHQFRFGRQEREIWLNLMRQAIADLEIPEPAAAQLMAMFEAGARHITGAPPTVTSEHWQGQLLVEQALAAAAQGNPDLALRIAEPLRESNIPVYAHILCRIISNGQEPRVVIDRPLAEARFALGRTLLHCAASQGRIPLVEELLRVGADTTTVLHAVANASYRSSAAPGDLRRVIEILVAAGADPNARTATQRTTPLHTAARRGSTEVTIALIDCGADVNVRDRTGATPLDRAIATRHPGVARILRTRGANLV